MEVERLWFERLREKRLLLAKQLKDPAASGLWRSVVDKYSDDAHFLYELLQNADDVLAENVRVFVEKDHIEFIHDGKIQFTITNPDEECEENRSAMGHINAITSIGFSNKNGEGKIGKFGVGFKSVFKYSDRPHIEDDRFSFVLEDYIVPSMTSRICLHRHGGETGFYLPIADPENDLPIIWKKCESLVNPLLFLNHVRSLAFISGENEVAYSKKTNLVKDWDGLKCEFVDQTNPDASRRFFYQISEETDDKGGKISCVFRANPDGGLKAEKEKSPLFSYFATSHFLNVNYLLHAPFLLTENRERLKVDDDSIPWNEKLMKRLGVLVVRGLQLLAMCRTKSDNLIVTANIVRILPMDTDFMYGDSDHLYDLHIAGIRDSLMHARIFMTGSGDYVTAENLILSDDKTLCNVFNEKDLFSLFPEMVDCRWAASGFYQDDSVTLPEIVKFLKDADVLKHYITLEFLLPRLSSKFLMGKSAQWFVSLYRYLDNRRNVWKQNPACKASGIFLCEDGTCRAAYAAIDDVRAQLFLPNEWSEDAVTVHHELADDANCRRFFEFVGISTPDTWNEISENILKLYEQNRVLRDDRKTIGTHIKTVFEYYDSLPMMSKERDEVQKKLSDIPILPVENGVGELSFGVPTECYLKSKTIEEYLKGNPRTLFFSNDWIKEFVVPEKRNGFYYFLSAIGVRLGLVVENRVRPNTEWELAELDLHPKSLRVSDNGGQVIIDRVIDGFGWMMENLTLERSVAFYNLLRSELEKQTTYFFRCQLEGVYRYFEKGKRTITEEPIRHSTAVKCLFQKKWIMNDHGDWCAPCELETINKLAAVYDRNDRTVLFFLGIRVEDSIQPITDKQRKILEMFERYEKIGLSEAMIEQILQEYLANETNFID